MLLVFVSSGNKLAPNFLLLSSAYKPVFSFIISVMGSIKRGMAVSIEFVVSAHKILSWLTGETIRAPGT